MPPKKSTEKNKISVKIGKAIEARRQLRNVSQEKMAELTDMSKNHYGCIERGEVDAPVMTLARITKALKWTLTDLFFSAKL